MESFLRITRRVLSCAVTVATLAVASVSFSHPVQAADPAQDKAMKLPETASDHLSLAKAYDERAATWRQEAAHHKEMAAAYKKSRPANDRDAMIMEKHCSKIMKDAETLAMDAEDTANYHRLRARELQGK